MATATNQTQTEESKSAAQSGQPEQVLDTSKSPAPGNSPKKLILIIGLAVIIIIVLIVGKLLTDKPAGDTTQKSDEDIINEVISGFTDNEPESFDRAEVLVDLRSGSIPLLLKHLTDNDLYSKWASLYALSRLGFDQDDATRGQIIEAVKNLTTDNEAQSIRIMAAGITVIFGDSSAAPILIEGLKTSEMLLLTEPPILICQYSTEVLEHYFQESFGTSCSWNKTDTKAYEGWMNWWDLNKDKLLWDNEAKLYKTN